VEENRDLASTARESLSEWRDTAETYASDIQSRLGDLDLRVREMVRTRPVACVAGAFAIGFIVARSFRKMRRVW
jgi:hypothetical protein